MKKTALAILTALTMAGGVYGVPAQATSLSSLFGQNPAQKFLPAHQAFGVTLEQSGDVLTARFKVTPEHYIYKDKLSLKLPEGVSAGEWQFDQNASWVEDPSFGRVAVFEKDFSASIRLNSKQNISEQASLRWQGCAKAGLCYPPENTTIGLNLTAQSANAASDKAKTDKKAVQADKAEKGTKADKGTSSDKAEITATTNQTSQTAAQVSGKQSSKVVDFIPAKPADDKTAKQDEQVKQSASKTDNPSASDGKQQSSAVDETAKASSENANADDASTVNPSDITKQASDGTPVANATDVNATGGYPLNHALPVMDSHQTNPILMVGLLFLAGLLLAFTPCIYPMVPIVANIVAQGDKQQSAKSGFALSAAYGVGVATAYGVLGAAIAWFGQALGIAGWFQRPAVLIGAAALFVLFALMMAGWMEIRLPAKISHALQSKSQAADDKLGSLSGSFLAGALSALVVSPCVSAPMAGALTAVSVSGNVIFGFLALFALGLGMSVPLMMMGAAQGRFMPKAGAWMVKVREFGALLLLGVALLLVERVLLSPAMLVLWAVWFAVVAIWLYKIGKPMFKLLAILPAIWAGCLLYGASQGSSNAWQPLKSAEQTRHQQAYPDIHATSLAQLDVVLASREKVLVDVTAEWCVECRIMERTLFTNRPAALADYQVVKLDITETTQDSRAILARYQLFGPPALLIYQQGTLKQVLLGETKREDFEQALSQP